MIVIDERVSEVMHKHDEFLQKVGITQAEYIYLESEALKRTALLDEFIRQKVIPYVLDMGPLGFRLNLYLQGILDEIYATSMLVTGHSEFEEETEDDVQVFNKRRVALYKELKKVFFMQKEDVKK